MREEQGGRKMPQKFLREIFSGRIVFSSLPLANVEEYKLPVPPEHAQSQSAAVAQTKAELREGRSANLEKKVPNERLHS